MTAQLRFLRAFGFVAALLLVLASSAWADVLYVSTELRDVDKITSAGAVSLFASVPAFPAGAYPAGLAFDSSGNLYATDPNKKLIDKITPDGTLSLFKSLPANSFPEGLTIDVSGNLYVPNVNGVQIAKVTPDGTLTVFASMPAGSDSEGLAFDSSGNLYVADSNNNQIDKITLAGAVSLFASFPANTLPEGLAFDGIGNLYEAGLDNLVHKITVGGAVSLFATLSNSTDSEAVGLAFDSSSNLYAAGLSGEISRITPDGTVSHFATVTFAGLYIAVTDDAGHPLAVPPATLLGDYSRDGIVDAADYAVWRKGLGTTFNQNDYDVWRAHFGQSAAGSGSSSAEASPSQSAVPEPASIPLLATALFVLTLRRRATSHRKQGGQCPPCGFLATKSYSIKAPYTKQPRAARTWATLVAGALVAAATAPAFAATWTWNGSQGNDHWTNSGNWTPAIPVGPANDGTANVIFAGIVRPTPDMNANWSVNSVTFDNTAGTFNLGTSTASTLTVGAGGISNNSTTLQNITHGIALGAAQTWSTALAGLAVTGIVNNAGNLLTIDPAAGATVEIDRLTGSGGLTKNGLGALLLQGAVTNAYTGTTTVNAGSLILQKNAGINAISGALNIGDGVGTAIDSVFAMQVNQLTGATVSVFSTGALYINGSSNSQTITSLSTVSTGIAGGGLVTVDGGAGLLILGNVTMNGGAVTTSSTGFLQLHGDITTNAASVSASIGIKMDLIDAAHTFTVGDGAAPIDLDISGVVINDLVGMGNSGRIIKAGPGAMRLGAANTYAGGTTLNAGTILMGNDAALGTGPVTGNGGALAADGAARTITNALSGSFGFDGAFDLTLNSPVNLSGGITKNGTGMLIFPQASTIGGAMTVNVGSVRFDAPFTAAGGLANSGTVLFGIQTLTVNGAGINNQGSLPLAGGTLAGSGPVVNNGLISGYGTIGGTGGFTNNAQLTVSGGSLTLAKAGVNANTGNVDVPSGLQLRLTGGALANTGAVNLDGGLVAGPAVLSNNAGGIVSGRGTISAPLANAGGTLRAVGGTLNVTSAFANSGVIRLDDAAALAGGAITNTGRIQGDGTISNALTNAAGGSIRVDAGNTLFFRGAFAANTGEMNLQGGTLDFAGAVTNSAGGFIAGRGAIYTGGLTNNGQMAFSGGTADIHGDVTLAAGSRVVTSGAGSVTTFFDDVTHNGLEIFTGAGASSVFFGSQSGAGSFTGTGTVYYIGDLRPGNSPAAVSYGGSVVLGGSTTLAIELGGAAPGTGYDQLHVTGALSLGGRLELSLINGFTPAAGSSFDILDWSSLSGTFSSLSFPSLTAGLIWNTSQLYTTGLLSVVSAGISGDYNGNGIVDAADYTVWRDHLGQSVTLPNDTTPGSVTQADYDVWRSNFGNHSGSGSDASAAVPEPASLLLLLSGTLAICSRRCQKGRKLINE